jgi:transposase-like protein
MFPVAVYYLSQADIAKELGVSNEAVRTWRKRYPEGSAHPFPEPDSWTGVDEVPAGELDARVNPRENSRSVPGWAPSRLAEIKAWRSGMPGPGARTDLS